MNNERTFIDFTKEQTNKPAAYITLMKNVYLWMTFALAATGLTAMYISRDIALMQTIASNSLIFYGLIIAELAVVLILSSRIMKMSFATAGIMFAAYSVLNGVTMAFLFLIYTQESIASTFFITAGTFGTMALIGTTTKSDLTSWGKILMMAVVGLIIATIVNIFMNSSILYWAISYLGVIVFVGLTAYDAQKIKQMLMTYGNDVNENSQKLALMGSLTLYLDFINLFIYLLRIFGNRK